jgi:hypothetical protein
MQYTLCSIKCASEALSERLRYFWTYFSWDGSVFRKSPVSVNIATPSFSLNLTETELTASFTITVNNPVPMIIILLKRSDFLQNIYNSRRTGRSASFLEQKNSFHSAATWASSITIKRGVMLLTLSTSGNKSFHARQQQRVVLENVRIISLSAPQRLLRIVTLHSSCLRVRLGGKTGKKLLEDKDTV